ncbi:MAG: hypothetical protein KDC98_19140, partial [Planctomycetes bacterium]|nr:hypothetical protein [Planctomycetota bacterium]
MESRSLATRRQPANHSGGSPMIRSIAWATVTAITLGSLAGCRAQEERRQLERTINKLESRLERMDSYVDSLKAGRATEAAELAKATAEKDAEMQRLKELVAAQESEIVRARTDSKKAENRLDELRSDLQNTRTELEQSHQNLRQLEEQQTKAAIAMREHTQRIALEAEERNQRSQLVAKEATAKLKQ